MAIEDIRKLNVRSPYFVEVVDEYLGVVTPPPPPPPDPEPNGTDGFYYRLTRCSDLSIFYSISYPAEPFSSSERVEDSSGVSYVISGSQEVEPAGVKKTITTTGLTGCPEVEVPEIPDVTAGLLPCSSISHFGNIVGITKFKLDTTDKDIGLYDFTISNAKVPVKYRAYIEGDTTLPAYTTIGLDVYAEEWLRVTGDNASSLSSELSNPNGVTQSFNFTTSATDVSKNIIIEIFAPIPTTNNMSIQSDSCQPSTDAEPSSATDFVTVISVSVHSVYNMFVNGATVPTSDITVKLNGVTYALPNLASRSGIRLIAHDSTPDYVVLSNNFPYTLTSGNFPVNQRRWSYETNGTTTMIPQEIGSNVVKAGINELKIEVAETVGCAVTVRIANHPVSNHPTIPNQRVINHRGDNTWSYISTAGKTLSMGNRDFASEEVFTVKFSGVNQKDVIINEATYAHEQIVNTNDQINEIDDITHHLPVYYVR
jgi:hypothetical protein